jgi:hypothetical protein
MDRLRRLLVQPAADYPIEGLAKTSRKSRRFRSQATQHVVSTPSNAGTASVTSLGRGSEWCSLTTARRNASGGAAIRASITVDGQRPDEGSAIGAHEFIMLQRRASTRRATPRLVCELLN